MKKKPVVVQRGPVTRESDKFILRLPEGMRAALADLAARNGRSMNAEAIHALAMYFAKEDTAPKQSEGVEAAIRKLSEQQQQTIETLELVKKIILSPARKSPSPNKE